MCWNPFRITIQFLRRFFVRIIESAYNSAAGGAFAEKNDFEYPPLTLWIFSAERLFLFRVCRALRSAPNAIFTEGVVTANGICSAAFCESAALREKGSPSQSSPVGLASSPKGRALWHGGKVSGRAVNFAGGNAPPGGAVAQRLRGYKWRSEKSVKAIAPTGAALAFLCFDFFFRIVKGEQPLARCGVGGVQR